MPVSLNALKLFLFLGSQRGNRQTLRRFTMLFIVERHSPILSETSRTNHNTVMRQEHLIFLYKFCRRTQLLTLFYDTHFFYKIA